ncbi:hypothetical protein GCM10029963_62920 [Micromonospora andamanensis]
MRLFQLTLGALRALAEGDHATTLVLDAYLLRGMALAGWAPALTACAVCGTPAGTGPSRCLPEARSARTAGHPGPPTPPRPPST